ncbi:MAG: ABC transporter ATP-binding protein [Candidatus Promineifilaceae bacterium]
MLLDLNKIEKLFNNQPILRGVSLQITPGEIVALLGPSGCGKTTLLRIIAGLEEPSSGNLLYMGDELTEIPVHERGFGLVFQDYALFPHKDVAGNIEFGLRMLGWDDGRRAIRVSQVLELVGLSGFEGREIHELSGGEQQRVALARSLAPSPRLLLLDEPMGSLDRALRERLMRELRAILKEAGGMLDRPEGITAVFVTHDQEEAFAVADRILVMNAGIIEQEGTPADLYRKPKNVFVASFLGMENIIKGKVVNQEPPRVSTSVGELLISHGPWDVGQGVTILIRPEAAKLDIPAIESYSEIRALLVSVSFRGRYQDASFEIAIDENTRIRLKFDFNTDVSLPRPGTVVTLYLDPAGTIVLED